MHGPRALAPSPRCNRTALRTGREWDRCGELASERHRNQSPGRSGRTAHRGVESSRQRHQIFRRKRRCFRQPRNTGRKTCRTEGSRPRRRHSIRRIETYLPPLLPRARPHFRPRERHGPRALYRSLDRKNARRQSFRRKCRRRPRHHGHPRAPEEPNVTKVLVVEDEAHLAEGLRFNLQAEGYAVEVTSDGEAALKRLLESNGRFDAVVLDVMLPGIDGFEVVSELRKAKNFIPVLILTARGRPEDVLEGFGAGADDYLSKPFELPIFLARLQGLLRRNEWLRSSKASTSRSTKEAASNSTDEREKVAFEGKTIDFGTLELRTERSTIQLTLMEAKLLRHLIHNKGRNVSRKSILEDVWGLSEDTDTRAIDNFIVRLRKYIEKNPAKPRHLLTVRGVGYRFVA